MSSDGASNWAYSSLGCLTEEDKERLACQSSQHHPVSVCWVTTGFLFTSMLEVGIDGSWHVTEKYFENVSL